MKINTQAIIGTVVGTVGVTMVAIIVKSILIFLFHSQEMKGMIFNPNIDLIVDYKERIISSVVILGAVLATVYQSMKIIPAELLKKYGRVVVIYVPVFYEVFFSEGMFARKWVFLCVFSVLGIWYHFRQEFSLKETMIGLTIAIVGGAIVSELIVVGGMNISKGQLIAFLSGSETETVPDIARNYTHYYIYQGLGIMGFLFATYFGFKRIPAKHYKWMFLFALSTLPLLHADIYLKGVATIGFLGIYFFLKRDKTSDTDREVAY